MTSRLKEALQALADAVMRWRIHGRAHESGEGAAAAEAPSDADGASPGSEGIPDGAELPLDGVLDLHTFLPREVPSLVDEWIRASAEKGIRHGRIVHGKGTGVLRTRVHAILKRHPLVSSYRLAGEDGGGWGATLVEIDAGGESASGAGGHAEKGRKPVSQADG